MEHEIDLSRLIGILWRGKIWVALFGLLFGGLGIWYAFGVATPSFTANATVVLESREQKVVNIDSVIADLSGDQSSINTEIEVFRSRILIENLVRDLNLTDDPEFNRSLQERPKISLGILVNYVLEIVSGPRPVRPDPSQRAILDATIDSTLRKITVTNIPSSYVFRIRVVTGSAKKSALIANRLAELYIEDQVRVKAEKTVQATKWLSERLAQLQVSLETSEENLKVFSSNTDLISMNNLVSLNRQLKEFRDRRQAIKAEVDLKTENTKRLEGVLEDGAYKAFNDLSNDKQFAQVLRDTSMDETAREQRLKALGKQLVERNWFEIKRRVSQLDAVDRSISEVTARIDRQSEEVIKLQQFQREVEANRLLYEAFLTRLKETSIQQGIQQADSRILSRAVIPLRPTSPRKMRILVLSAFFGTLIGTAVVVFFEVSKNTFRTSDDLESFAKSSVLGQIPKIPARRRKNVLKYLTEKPNSAAAESIRNLRTSVLLSNLDKPPKVIMSTSGLPGEGKTTQSLALAQNFAGLGQKVLLIEGDIRRRVFSQYFDIKETRGLLSVLAGKAELSEVAVYNEELRADVLIGEKSSTNAADVFSSKKFSEFLNKARETYDAIIIDTPPVLVVPDARVIGQSVDAILYTVKWDSTTRTQVREGLRMFETVNLKVTGLVLGQIDAKGMKRYGYGGEYGAYGAYGAKYYHN